MTVVGDWENRIDTLLDRVDALFPQDDDGFGKHFRRSLDAVEYHKGRFSWQSAEGILVICEELIGVMERTERELAEMNKWADECEREVIAGVSLRAIGDVCMISHQTVQNICDRAGGLGRSEP